MKKHNRDYNTKLIDGVFAILMCALFILGIVLAFYAAFASDQADEVKSARTAVVSNGALAINSAEDCNESQKIADAVVESIGTEKEEEVVGYDMEIVARTIYAEAGGNSEELQRAVATCIFNSQKASGWTLSPTEVIEQKQYATSDTYTEEVMSVCIDVFLNGNLYEPIAESGAEYFHSLGRGNATDFHDNPCYCEWVMYLDGEDFYRSV